MRAKDQISLVQKTMYGIMLLTVFLSGFGEGNYSFVHAQAQAATSNMPATNGQKYYTIETNGIDDINAGKSEMVAAQTGGTHQITHFKDNKAGAVSFTFDDGYISQATTAVSELNARGLKGTFFLVTDTAWINSHVPWVTWQGIVAQGHEVAAHTVSHEDLTLLSEGEMRSELTESQFAIAQNLPGQACASLSYPYTNSNGAVQTAASDYFVAARAGFVEEIVDGYLNYTQAGSDQSGSWNAINFYNVGSRGGDGMIPATDSYFNYLLNTAASRHAWFSLHFHNANDATAFGNILDYIQDKPGYWIDTFCNISRYMKERLNTTVQVITENTSEIRLNFVMNALPPTGIYNFPLTIRSTVPASWTEITFQQGSTVDELASVIEGNARVVYYDIIPNGGEVVLTDSTQPAAFNKTSPANGAVNQPTSLTLSWASSVGAASYEYCHDTSNDNACSSWTSNGNSTSKALSGLNAGATYYWHVRAVNSGGSTYANNSSTAFWSFTLSCYTLTKNAAYGVVNTSPAPNCNNGTQYTHGTAVTLTAAPNTGYALFGWSGDASGSSNPLNLSMTANKTITATFTGFISTLSAPTLRSPQTNWVTLNKTPTLLWTTVLSGQTYETVIATDNAFATVVNSKMLNGSSYTVAPAFGDGKYYWRVRAYNASNQFGKWSSVRTFTIDTTAPSMPVLSFPANISAVTRTPTFKWLTVPAAANYEFQYDNNSDFSSPTYTGATRSNFRKPPAMPKGTYYWRVRAQDSTGNWSAWSAPFTVSITGP